MGDRECINCGECIDTCPVNAISLGSKVKKADTNVAEATNILIDLRENHKIFCSVVVYPVVPKGQARIRVQVSAGHEMEHLDKCIAAFTKVGKEMGVLK